MRLNETTFLTYKLFCDSLEKIKFTNKSVISTLNPYSFLIAENDKQFKSALLNSDILLPDGQGIVWAARFLYGKSIKRIAGYDIFEFLIKQLNVKGGKCFFLGSTEVTLEKITKKLSKEFPNLKVEAYSPPFKEIFDDDDNKLMIEKINTFKPDILFVGMTAPKQEKWVYENKSKLNVNSIASIGAVFDYYAGNLKRASKFWIRFGMEWFIRFLQEPRRLFKRNIYSVVFAYKIIKEKFRK